MPILKNARDAVILHNTSVQFVTVSKNVLLTDMCCQPNVERMSAAVTITLPELTGSSYDPDGAGG